MEKNFLSVNEVMDAIARGLQPGTGTTRLFIALILSLIILLVVMERIFHHRSIKKTRESALAAFEKKIRKLDLTINEIDFLNLMSTCLKKPWKKYLLLSNKNTFTNSAALLLSQDPDSLKLDLVRSISRKAGFEILSLPGKKTGTRKVYPGSPIKIVLPGGRLFAGEVIQSSEDLFEFRTAGPLPENTGEIIVYLIDFAGISGFQTRIVSGKPDNIFLARHSDTPRALAWENPGKAGVDDQVYILSDEQGDTPVHARLKSVRPGWMILETSAGTFRKGQDIRIFLTRKISQGLWINGEIEKVSRNKKALMVKLSHVKSPLS